MSWIHRKFLSPLAVALTLLAAASGSTQSLESDFGGFGSSADAPEVFVRSELSVTSAAPGKTYVAAVVIDLTDPWHVNSANPRADWLIPVRVTFDTTEYLTPFGITYPVGENLFLAGDTMAVYSGITVIPFAVRIDDDAPDGLDTLPVSITYQPCNDVVCAAPETVEIPIEVQIGPEGEPINPRTFSGLNVRQFSDQERKITPKSGTGVEEESQLTELIRDYGFWGYFLALGLAFLTGLLLSFSPCTYPMIPITVSIFAGQQRSMGKGFGLSLIYVVSMAVVYGIMGLIVSLVGGVFGAWLASPPVVIAIVIVFVVFSLSMFGLYEIQVPMALRQKLGTRKGGGGVFSVIMLGIVAALVVSPCVGPFVAGILIYIATTGSPVIGFFVLFVFALGLGTLYVLIGTFSSAISKLPGSGEWMESVKKFFGFVLLLMALYFLDTLISRSLTAVLTGLLLVAFGVFGGGLDRLTPELGFFPRLKKFLGILALLVGGYLLIGIFLSEGFILQPASRWLPVSTGTVEVEESLISWETDLDDGLARARAENKPVLIDTWATWCANCRVLEKKTFGNPRVADEARNFVPIKVQLENADTDITQDFMSRFGMTHYSLPTTLLLDPDGNVQKILRGVVGPDDMISAMHDVRSGP